MNNLVYFRGNSGWCYDCGLLENNLVYFWDYSAWAYDYDSFLGCWEIT